MRLEMMKMKWVMKILAYKIHFLTFAIQSVNSKNPFFIEIEFSNPPIGRCESAYESAKCEN
jgi:hypothetical protein